MREIKFRAWDKERKIMGMVASLTTGDDDTLVLWDFYPGNGFMDNIDSNTRRDYVLMQYTGLKDKNGVPIFEGDIIEWIEEPTNKNTFHEICWIDKEGCWGTKDSIWLCNTNMNYRVIGNVWENPELLKGK